MPRKKVKVCEHIIGYDISDYGLSDLVSISISKECMVEFDYCPNCGARLDTVEGLQHRTTGAAQNYASCKWGLDVCPFDVAHKQCSTCKCDKTA